MKAIKILGGLWPWIAIIFMTFLVVASARAVEASATQKQFDYECTKGINDSKASLKYFVRKAPLKINRGPTIKILAASRLTGPGTIKIVVKNGTTEEGAEVPVVVGVCLSKAKLLDETTKCGHSDICFHSGPKDRVTIQIELDTASLPHDRWIADTDANGNPANDGLAQSSVWMKAYDHASTSHIPPGPGDWPPCANPKQISLSGNTIFFPFGKCVSATSDYDYALHLQRCADSSDMDGMVCVDIGIDPRIINRP
jgi:hypothetical protein